MELIKTNSWSCLPTAFSMALGIPFAQVIDIIGHDGSEFPFKDKTFRRGFHIQECIDACFTLGYACVEIQRYFGMQPYYDSVEAIPAYSFEVCDKRFKDYLIKSQGVLAGRVERNSGVIVGHAVAWNGLMIYDSRGMIYDFEQAEMFNFNPHTLWILVKMEK